GSHRAGRRRRGRRQPAGARLARGFGGKPPRSLRRAAAAALHRQRGDDRVGGARASGRRGRGRSARHRRAAALAARSRSRAGTRRRSQGVSPRQAHGERRLGVVGAGAWGTALAQMLAADGIDVLLWAREPELVDEINARHTNSLFLPSAMLASSIRATGDLGQAAECDILLLVTPAQHLAATLAQMPRFPRDLVLCAKGIEAGSGRTMHEVARDAAPDSDIAVLSGPTFAHEVAAGLPTAVTLA